MMPHGLLLVYVFRLHARFRHLPASLYSRLAAFASHTDIHIYKAEEHFGLVDRPERLDWNLIIIREFETSIPFPYRL
jgi:hypothetical protein